ncbi:hypothetical protein EBN03_20145 [Nocardia stercoris]|uniref:4-hydroxybenzoyl-CoA thioesterase n=1 Tax=Nocardia stercoris TaxID=2483361 RepID=A0A3M2L0Z2_9NOCA|nr:hypothetical protein EBN03_20145 [Nocardia stercoris]
MGFTSTWAVRAGDVDPYHRLRLDAVARYLQDIATEETHASTIRNTDPDWILRRTVIDVVRPVTFPDRVELRRWCSALSTRWANMRVRLTSDNGGLIETEGFWIKINAATNLPTRISDEGMAYLGRTATEQRLRWRPWLSDTLPPASESDVAFPLRATDIDQYNHVNNAVYWQIAEGFLIDYPKLVVGSHRAVIEYLAPVLARQQISVRSRYEPAGAGGHPLLQLWLVADGQVATIVKIGPLPH